jgi:hypothetical protein
VWGVRGVFENRTTWTLQECDALLLFLDRFLYYRQTNDGYFVKSKSKWAFGIEKVPLR